jgi:hypothetical protein
VKHMFYWSLLSLSLSPYGSTAFFKPWLFHFLNLHTIGVTPSQGNYLHTEQHKQNKWTQTIMLRVGFEQRAHCDRHTYHTRMAKPKNGNLFPLFCVNREFWVAVTLYTCIREENCWPGRFLILFFTPSLKCRDNTWVRILLLSSKSFPLHHHPLILLYIVCVVSSI